MHDKRFNSPLLAAIRPLLPAYGGVLALSFFCPLLYLSAPLYAEQIFDRVIYSRNVTTLFALCAITTFMLVMYAVLEWVRKMAMLRVGNAIDARLSAVVFDAASHQAAGARGAALLNDFAIVRESLSGNALLALFDAFWSPLFIIVMVWVNWLFGAAGLVMIVLTGFIAFVNHRLSRHDIARSHGLAVTSQELTLAVMRNAETARALGMMGHLRERWLVVNRQFLGWQSSAMARMEIFSTATKFLRNYQLVGIYTIGTLLFLANEATLSNAFVAMTLMMRGLGPIDQVIGNWKSYANALAALDRLDHALDKIAEQPRKVSLAALEGRLAVSRVFVAAQGTGRPLLSDVSFSLEPGRSLGVIGASGAGKSCLARVLAGAWSAGSGSVAIGAHDLAHRDEEERGKLIGYMPQDVELLPGTIAENIARFDPSLHDDSSALLAAVELAGIGDMIRALPEGLNTKVGANGHVLSGGQRARIALARALYREPKFVVLDEPNAALDQAAEQALMATLRRIRERGATVVIVTHKLNILAHCDDVLVLNAGSVQAFGPRDQIVSRAPRPGAPALTLVASAGEAR